MLQENERLSSDRLLHVRVKQPYSSAACTNSSTSIPLEGKSVAAGSVSTGEICAFLFQINDLYSWDIGKILQFSSNKRNGPQNKIYCDEFANVSTLCHWYTKSDGRDTKYKLHTDVIVHEYFARYVTCTRYITVNLKLTVLLNHMYQINTTSALPIIFATGVNLHLTKSSVIRIKEIFQRP